MLASLAFIPFSKASTEACTSLAFWKLSVEPHQIITNRVASVVLS